jgi:hypothetical protein
MKQRRLGRGGGRGGGGGGCAGDCAQAVRAHPRAGLHPTNVLHFGDGSPGVHSGRRVGKLGVLGNGFLSGLVGAQCAAQRRARGRVRGWLDKHCGSYGNGRVRTSSGFFLGGRCCEGGTHKQPHTNMHGCDKQCLVATRGAQRPPMAPSVTHHGIGSVGKYEFRAGPRERGGVTFRSRRYVMPNPPHVTRIPHPSYLPKIPPPPTQAHTHVQPQPARRLLQPAPRQS